MIQKISFQMWAPCKHVNPCQEIYQGKQVTVRIYNAEDVQCFRRCQQR